MMPNWTPAEYAAWERAWGVSEQEIERRAKERAKTKKLNDEMVAAHHQICEDCGVNFMPKMGEVRCGKCRAKRLKIENDKSE